MSEVRVNVARVPLSDELLAAIRELEEREARELNDLTGAERAMALKLDRQAAERLDRQVFYGDEAKP